MGRLGIEETHHLSSPTQTKEFAHKLVQTLEPNTVIALYGQLGSGKTTFVQGLLAGLGGMPQDLQSPTFTYMQSYDSTPPLFHFDLYRLQQAEEFLKMGFDETFEQNGIVAIEWPERIEALLTLPHLTLRLSHFSEHERTLVMQWS